MTRDECPEPYRRIFVEGRGRLPTGEAVTYVLPRCVTRHVVDDKGEDWLRGYLADAFRRKMLEAFPGFVLDRPVEAYELVERIPGYPERVAF